MSNIRAMVLAVDAFLEANERYLFNIFELYSSSPGLDEIRYEDPESEELHDWLYLNPGGSIGGVLIVAAAPYVEGPVTLKGKEVRFRLVVWSDQRAELLEDDRFREIALEQVDRVTAGFAK